MLTISFRVPPAARPGESKSRYGSEVLIQEGEA